MAEVYTIGKSVCSSLAPSSQKRSKVLSTTEAGSASGLSILLITTRMRWPMAIAFLSTKRVCLGDQRPRDRRRGRAPQRRRSLFSGSHTATALLTGSEGSPELAPRASGAVGNRTGCCELGHFGRAGLRLWPVLGVDEQQHAIHHVEHSLDLAAKVRVACARRGVLQSVSWWRQPVELASGIDSKPRTWRVDNIDLNALVVDRGVLGEDRDAALALLVVAIHEALVLADALIDGT